MKSSLMVTSERIGNLIRMGKTDEAEKALSDIPQEDKAWRRMFRHYEGKISMVRGDFKTASEQLHNTIKDEGPHILIYADLVATYYLARQYTKWKIAVDDFDREYRHVKAQLNDTNCARAEIILAKSLELNGEIAKAYQIFSRLSESASMDFRIKGLLNLVRIEAQYPLSVEFKSHYYKLKSFSFGLEVPDSDYDVLHSLVLAEAEHLSKDLACTTLQLIPRDQTCYYALGYYELLDIWLRVDKNALKKIQDRLGVVQPFTEFDSLLLKLAEGTSVSDWYRWPSFLPLSQYFRLLRFLLPQLNSKDRDICLQQAHLLLGSLSDESRQIWEKFFTRDNLKVWDQEKLKLRPTDSGTYFINEIPLDFGRQKLILQLLKLVVEGKGEVSLKVVARHLWDMDFDNYSHDRIRQLVKRANQIARQTIHNSLFKIYGETLHLAPELQLESTLQ